MYLLHFRILYNIYLQIYRLAKAVHNWFRQDKLINRVL